MKKVTLEYFRDKNSIKGYGYISQPKQLSDNSVLDFLCKWSKNKKVKIYSHSLKRVEENISKTKFYYSSQDHRTQEERKDIYDNTSDDAPFKSVLRNPYCDWVYYIDIYYQ